MLLTNLIYNLKRLNRTEIESKTIIFVNEKKRTKYRIDCDIKQRPTNFLRLNCFVFVHSWYGKITIKASTSMTALCHVL